MQRAYGEQPEDCRPFAANGFRFRDSAFRCGALLRLWGIGKDSRRFSEIAAVGSDDHDEVWHPAAEASIGAGNGAACWAANFTIVAIGAKTGANTDAGIGEGRGFQCGRCAQQP